MPTQAAIAWRRATLALALLMLSCVSLHAQEPDAVEDETAEPNLGPDQDEPDDSDEDDEYIDEEDVIDEPGDWRVIPMDDEEDWGGELDEDLADDAIPIDEELSPDGEDWEVVEYEDVDDGAAIADGAGGDLSGPGGDLPVIRQAVRRAPRPAGADEDTPYSMGGKPVRQKGAPWQAQIYYPRRAEQWAEQLRQGKPLWQLQHRCGGALIAPQWVLTAAHCIDEDDVRAGYRVRLGVQDISRDQGVSYRIDRIVRHSQYEDKPLPASPNRYFNDIALIHIVYDGPPRKIDPTQISPIALYEGPVAPRAEVSATGWGKTAPVDAHQPNAVLLKVDMKVMDTERCKSLPGYGPAKIHNGVICAADPGRSTCRGDSGGALTFTNGAPKVVGIVSWGKKRCSGDGQPGAYTRVASYIDWIKRAMQLDPSKNALP